MISARMSFEIGSWFFSASARYIGSGLKNRLNSGTAINTTSLLFSFASEIICCRLSRVFVRSSLRRISLAPWQRIENNESGTVFFDQARQASQALFADLAGNAGVDHFVADKFFQHRGVCFIATGAGAIRKGNSDELS